MTLAAADRLQCQGVLCLVRVLCVICCIRLSPGSQVAGFMQWPFWDSSRLLKNAILKTARENSLVLLTC